MSFLGKSRSSKIYIRIITSCFTNIDFVNFSYFSTFFNSFIIFGSFVLNFSIVFWKFSILVFSQTLITALNFPNPLSIKFLGNNILPSSEGCDSKPINFCLPLNFCFFISCFSSYVLSSYFGSYVLIILLSTSDKAVKIAVSSLTSFSFPLLKYAV